MPTVPAPSRVTCPPRPPSSSTFPPRPANRSARGWQRYSTIRRVRLADAALDKVPDWAITIGGDCGAAVAAAAHAQARSGGDVAVLWLDAHPDLNTPESSPSGGFGGMALRAIVGEGPEGLALDEATRVAPGRVVLGGVHAVDDEERRFIDENGVTELTVEDLADPAVVVAAIEATGAGRVFVHIDLDVLDPSALAGLSYPMPFGIGAPELAALLRAVAAPLHLAGASDRGVRAELPRSGIRRPADDPAARGRAHVGRRRCCRRGLTRRCA